MKWISLTLFMLFFQACGKEEKSPSLVPEKFQPAIEATFFEKQIKCNQNISVNANATDALAFPSGDFYLIYTATQLQNINKDEFSLQQNYRVMTHLDLEGKSFSIGTNRIPYQGVFDGQYCDISGLEYTSDKSSGLFSYTNNAVIEKIALINFHIKGSVSGALVAYANETQISRILVLDSKIEGKNAAGGIIGVSSDSELSFVSVSNSSIASENFSGGIAGRMVLLDGTCTSKLEYFLSSQNKIYGNRASGSLMGGSDRTKIFQGISSGHVQSKERTGALLGIMIDSEVSEVLSIASLDVLEESKGYIFGENDGSTFFRVFYNSAIDCLGCTVYEFFRPIGNLNKIYKRDSDFYKNWDFEKVWKFGSQHGPLLKF